MNYLKKLITLAFAFCLVANFAIAQKDGSRKNAEMRIQKNTAGLTEQLELNETQAAEITKINMAFHEKMKAARTENQEANKAAMKVASQEKKQAIMALLTPEQAAKFEALPKKGKGPNAHKGLKGRKGPGAKGSKAAHRANKMAKMTENLSLTEEQVTMINAIDKKYAEQMKGLRAPENREQNEAAREAIKVEKDKEIKAVLNAEQLTKFEAMETKRAVKPTRGVRGEFKKS